jgi:hypothetical protein
MKRAPGFAFMSSSPIFAKASVSDDPAKTVT